MEQASRGFEQARVPERLICRRNGQIGRALAQFGQQAGEFCQPDRASELIGDASLLQEQAQDIDEWLIRQLSPGLQSSPHQYVGPLRLCPAEKFAGQARFADPGFSLEQDQLRLSRLRALVTLDQGAELGCSSQERALQQVRRWLSWQSVRRPEMANLRRTGRSSVTNAFGQRNGLGFRLDLQFVGQDSTATGVRA